MILHCFLFYLIMIIDYIDIIPYEKKFFQLRNSNIYTSKKGFYVKLISVIIMVLEKYLF